MEKRSFFFKNIKVQACKVSEGLFIGLPSLTSLNGLGKLFAIRLAQSLKVPVESLDLDGFSLAIQDYQRVESAPRGVNTTEFSKGLGVQFLPIMQAHFTAHLYLEIKANTQQARSALFEAEHRDAAMKALMSCKLSQGNLTGQPVLVDLTSPRFDRYGPRLSHRFLGALPSTALVLRDASDLIAAMREEGMDLMLGLVNAVLPPQKRAEPYKSFFDDVQESLSALAPVSMGFTYLEKTPSGHGTRKGAGEFNQELPFVSSTAYGLVRLQTAASVRLSINPSDANQDPRPACVVFKEVDCPTGLYIRSTETLEGVSNSEVLAAQ